LQRLGLTGQGREPSECAALPTLQRRQPPDGRQLPWRRTMG
jgi:hypothetical protein